MNRAIEVRLAKLEANVPAPASPFDGLRIDELSVLMLEKYLEFLPRERDSRGNPHRCETAFGAGYMANHRNGQLRLGTLGNDAWFRQLSGALG
jgi:hypothetical protein